MNNKQDDKIAWYRENEGGNLFFVWKWPLFDVTLLVLVYMNTLNPDFLHYIGITSNEAVCHNPTFLESALTN